VCGCTSLGWQDCAVPERPSELSDEELDRVAGGMGYSNLDLQNNLQNQQQMFQLLSNTAKLLGDTSMNLVRKLGG
jgi:hypothetical protein